MLRLAPASYAPAKLDGEGEGRATITRDREESESDAPYLHRLYGDREMRGRSRRLGCHGEVEVRERKGQVRERLGTRCAIPLFGGGAEREREQVRRKP